MLYRSKWPRYTDTMKQSVLDVLDSGKVNQWTGNHVKEFEKEYAEYFGMEHAVAVSNGTVSLEAALHALGIGKGDEVIVTPRSFIASVSVVKRVGAIPVFADVELVSQNISAQTMSEVITERTKAVILVHLAGYPSDMDPIVELCAKYNIDIIEDCAQSHGAKYKDKYLGTFGVISSWSFCQDKIISTAGEGGMILTNRLDLYKKMWSYKDHGKDYDMVHSDNKTNSYRYLHKHDGTNYRMTEIQAVVGRESLRLLEEWINIRKRNAKILTNKLSSLTNITISEPVIGSHAYYKYYIHLTDEYIAARDRIIDELNNKGVQASQGSCGRLYDEKVVAEFKKTSLPNSEKLMDNSIMLPVDTTFDVDMMEQIADIVYTTIKSHE